MPDVVYRVGLVGAIVPRRLALQKAMRLGANCSELGPASLLLVVQPSIHATQVSNAGGLVARYVLGGQCMKAIATLRRSCASAGTRTTIRGLTFGIVVASGGRHVRG